jgi:DNA-binding MarR family transcriptional regulator
MKKSSTTDHSRRLAKADYEALAQFRYVLRKFMGFSEDAARAAGLTAQQHQALLAIHGFPGRERVVIGELAERLNVRHHSVVGLIDRLSAKALVRRRRDALDRRRVLIELTAKGRSLLAGLSLAHRNELRRLAPLLIRLLAHVQGNSNP